MTRICDGKIGAPCRNEGYGNGSTGEEGEKWLDSRWDDIREKGLSRKEV